MQAEALPQQEPHQRENPHQYIKDLHLLQNQAHQAALTTAVLTVREEVQRADTQEIHTTETVLHQAQATLAAARTHQVDTHVEAQASPVAHQEAATAEVHHQEAIDDKNIKT